MARPPRPHAPLAPVPRPHPQSAPRFPCPQALRTGSLAAKAAARRAVATAPRRAMSGGSPEEVFRECPPAANAARRPAAAGRWRVRPPVILDGALRVAVSSGAAGARSRPAPAAATAATARYFLPSA